jgi:arsenite/tail-anchored protein-transporting ATPase
MRVLLFTGKGGVGKTTAAAGSAALAARRGLKTLVLSTDAAHSLGDALAVDPATARAAGAEPVETAGGLYVQQLDAQRRFERSWGEVREYLLTVLDVAGIDSVAAQELTVLPGAAELLALLEVRNQVRSGRWDLVVVDCAPTAETLRLLALPEALGWYMERLAPPERRVARSLRPMLSPVLGKVAGLPMPSDGVFDAIGRLTDELAQVRAVLTDPGTSVRLVLTPEAVVVAEARRTLTSLSLFGYRVDAVVANRIFPAGGADSWRAGWVAAQAEQLADVEDSFGPLPVYRSPFQPAEPIGFDCLADLAGQMYGADNADPFAAPTAADRLSDPLTVERSGDEFVLSLALPFADRGEMDLARTGDELVVTVAGYRRVLALPSVLRRCKVSGAALRDGRLRVRFEPDPALWMGL